MKKPIKKYYGTIIDRKAGIIAINSHLNLFSLSKELSKNANKNIYIVCGIWWSIESFKEILKSILIFLQTRILFPKIKFSIMCNTINEYKLMRLLGVKSIYCNQNCFIDENIFKINKTESVKYDAVYNGVLKSFKRHELCKNIENLVLVTYNFSNTEYKKYLENILKNPFWANYSDDGVPTFLDNNKLVEIYNKSKVGLALSKVEGAMYTSTEYLLCGLPVVSTNSKGGRDVYYDDYNSIIVASHESDVKLAVDKLLSKKIDGNIIRENALNISKRFRKEFFEHINDILKKNKCTYSIENKWDEWFVNKLRNELTAEEILRAIE